MKLVEHLAAARRLAEDDATLVRRAPDVSAWSVGQQLEHLAKANDTCLQAVRALSAQDGAPAGKPTFAGRMVLRFGRIPRGRGSAPEFTVPGDEPAPDDVRALLAAAEEAARGVEPPPKGGPTRTHPALGEFTAAQWLRFAEIHANHHLRIIRDILGA